MEVGPFEVEGNNIIGGVKAGLEAFAVEIMRDSREQCPYETGTLRDSSKILPAVENGDNVEVTMGYGFGDAINEKTHRPAAEYAVPVHEKVEAKHKLPTKAKFLEDPVFAHAVEMGAVLKAYVEWSIKGITTRITQVSYEGADLAAGPEVPASGLDAGDHPKGTPHV